MSREDCDYRVQLIYEEYGVSFRHMVKTLNITEQTITSGLEIMAEEILLGEGNLSHVFVLLVFCMELDKHCKLKKVLLVFVRDAYRNYCKHFMEGRF